MRAEPYAFIRTSGDVAAFFPVSFMRRKSVLFPLLLAAGIALPASSAFAQYGQGRPGQDSADQEAAAAKKKNDDWNLYQAPLPGKRNAGPCPYVKVLYDAARYMEFKDGKESPTAVGFTGEITGLRATCEYKGSDPIKVALAVDFALGRGPMASAPSKDFHYWVAVTERNAMVIAKEEFTVRGDFKNGVDRVNTTDVLQGVTIPRATTTTSGGNFEILVGFDVTPEMASFNRDGKRFRANATAVAAAGAPSGATAAR